MTSPERIEPQRESPHIEKIHSILDSAEREIQKECLSTGQPWINGFITQWNIVQGNLELAELFGEISKDELAFFKRHFVDIREMVDGEGGLREKYQSNDILMPQEEKEKLLEMLDIFSTSTN